METETVFVTPELARQFLERNTGNARPLSLTRARQFAQIIQDDEWVTTHQGIAFDEHGDLLDGQHRLKGIALAGRGVFLPVTTGVPSEANAVVDCGSIRHMQYRLRLPRNHTKCATFLTRLFDGEQHSPTSARVSHVYQCFQASIDEVCTACPGRRRIVTRAEVLAAATLRHMRAGEHKALFFERLRLWNAMRFCDLPPVFTVLYGQVDERRMDPREVFARAWDAFDTERTDRRTLRLSSRDGALEVITAVRKMFAGCVAFTKTDPNIVAR